MEMIKAILARGANANAQLTHNLPGRSGMDSGDIALDEGTTPFMRAARSGDAATMRISTRSRRRSQGHHQGRKQRAALRRGRWLSRQEDPRHRSPGARSREGGMDKVSISTRPIPRARPRCTGPRCGAPICWSSSWWNTAPSSMPSPKQGSRLSTSPWEKTALAHCRFRTTALSRCCEAGRRCGNTLRQWGNQD